jgi:hypothetical protein
VNNNEIPSGKTDYLMTEPKTSGSEAPKPNLSVQPKDSARNLVTSVNSRSDFASLTTSGYVSGVEEILIKGVGVEAKIGGGLIFLFCFVLFFFVSSFLLLLFGFRLFCFCIHIKTRKELTVKHTTQKSNIRKQRPK